MFKLVALRSPPKPEDRAAFEAAYRDTHVPLARALPGLWSVDTILIGEGAFLAPSDDLERTSTPASTLAR